LEFAADQQQHTRCWRKRTRGGEQKASRDLGIWNPESQKRVSSSSRRRRVVVVLLLVVCCVFVVVML
jgi:ferric-dicitrate binding protein FerR (iron transport regulator)